jgi:hypothetical protein
MIAITPEASACSSNLLLFGVFLPPLRKKQFLYEQKIPQTVLGCVNKI